MVQAANDIESERIAEAVSQAIKEHANQKDYDTIIELSMNSAALYHETNVEAFRIASNAYAIAAHVILLYAKKNGIAV